VEQVGVADCIQWLCRIADGVTARARSRTLLHGVTCLDDLRG